MTTAQEIVDKIWNWFAVQKQPRGWDSELERCAYRGDGGSRCAVGCLLEDDEVPDRNLAVVDLIVCMALPERLTPHMLLLSRLQEWHDSSAMVKGELDWDRFAEICRTHGLRVPV